MLHSLRYLTSRQACKVLPSNFAALRCRSLSTTSSASTAVDGMPRYPGTCPGGILRGLDYFGTVVFGYTGGIMAAQHGLDLLGVAVVGSITAIGGGTLRDLLIFARTPFWSGSDGEGEYLYLAGAGAVAAFFLYPSLEQHLHKDGPALQWADALGLGAFAVIGTMSAIRGGLSPLLCTLSGMSTATFGGLTRDVLVARKGGVRIFNSHAELYASCAAAASVTYQLLRAAHAPLWAKVLCGVGVGVVTRAAAWEHSLKLPTWVTQGHAHLVHSERRAE
jgi:uncharacterized membrane protein YeiH